MIRSVIYKIQNIIDNKVYIGSAVDFIKRFRQHKCKLAKNQHHSKHLQYSWNKYGENNFKFDIIELVEDPKKLVEREQYWIDYYKSYAHEFGYNIVPTAGSQLGYKHSEETLNKMRGQKRDKSFGKQISIRQLGRKLSQDTRLKMSQSQLNAQNERIFNFTPETLLKMSESHKGQIAWNKGLRGFYGKRNCLWCGTEFELECKTDTQIFCSRSCRSKNRWKKI